MFLVANTQLYKRLCPSVRPSLRPSVRWSVMIESKSGKKRVSAPAHPSATDGRVSGLVETGKGFNRLERLGEAIPMFDGRKGKRFGRVCQFF